MSTRGSPTAALAILVGTLGAAGCLFIPDIAGQGYTPCTSDSDCALGRFCEADVCSPPPWNDEAFEERRLLVVKNPSETTIPAGTAIPVVVGTGGALAIKDVHHDARFTRWDRQGQAWQDVGVHRDVADDADHYTFWIPLPADLNSGRTGLLAWMEGKTAAGDTAFVQDGAGTFGGNFETFEEALDEERWFIRAPAGTSPTVADGQVTIADDQVLTLKQPFVPPVSLTMVAWVNGVSCSQAFLGFVGDDRALLPTPPLLGFQFEDGLQVSPVAAPTSTSQIEPLATPVTVVSVPHRFTVEVDGGTVRFLLDGAEFAAPDEPLRPAFGGESLYPTIEVGDACSVQVEAMWVTGTPLPSPEVSAERVVHLRFFEDGAPPSP